MSFRPSWLSASTTSISTTSIRSMAETTIALKATVANQDVTKPPTLRQPGHLHHLAQAATFRQPGDRLPPPQRLLTLLCYGTRPAATAAAIDSIDSIDSDNPTFPFPSRCSPAVAIASAQRSKGHVEGVDETRHLKRPSKHTERAQSSADQADENKAIPRYYFRNFSGLRCCEDHKQDRTTDHSSHKLLPARTHAHTRALGSN